MGGKLVGSEGTVCQKMIRSHPDEDGSIARMTLEHSRKSEQIDFLNYQYVKSTIERA
jgi:hypothetical protein